jgi:hypothetical protein
LTLSKLEGEVRVVLTFRRVFESTTKVLKGSNLGKGSETLLEYLKTNADD